MRRLFLGLLIAVVLVVVLPPFLADQFGYAPDASAMGPRGQLVSIGAGRSLNVLESGSGSAIILIHGLPGSARDWTKLMEPLSRRHRVIAYDRVGYGWSSRASLETRGAYTYGSSASDLAGLLDALAIDRAALVGHSYGGGVAQLLARQSPERVSHLILVASVGPGLDEKDDPMGLVNAIATSSLGAGIFRWIGSIPPLARSMVHGSMQTAYSRTGPIPPAVENYYLSMLWQPGTLEAFSAETQRGRVAVLEANKIATPTLIIHGTDDLLVPFAVAEALDEQIPNAKLEPVFEGSHMLPLTHAEKLAAQLDRFIGTGWAPPAATP